MQNILKHVIALLLALIGMHASLVHASHDFNTDNDGIFVHGYDLISYFQGNPEPGSPSIQSNYHGARLYFSSLAHKQQFDANPGRYLPQFNGYCSYGVRMGKKLDIDPHAYRVLDDKLYLLLNRSTQTIWQQDLHKNITIANRLWKTLDPIPAGELNNN